jgi:hypothetical protein
MHFLGALFKAENEGIFLLLLLFPEVGDGEWLSGNVEALELFNIIADVVVGEEDAAVFLIENKQVFREDVTDPFQFVSGEDSDPLLKGLPLPEFLEEL